MPDIAALEAITREAGVSADTPKNSETYRRFLELTPAQWGVALKFALEMEATGLWSETDACFRNAAYRFPDEFWIQFHWTLSAWRARKAADAEALARRLLDRFSHMYQPHELIGDIAIDRMDFPSAITHYQSALSLANDNPGCLEKLAEAKLYHRVTTGGPASPGFDEPIRECDYSIAVVNMDRSLDRFESVQKAFEDSPVPMLRIPGVPGSYLPTVAIKALTGSSQASISGVLGNFLSHVAGWEWVIREGLAACLMIEDDAKCQADN